MSPLPPDPYKALGVDRTADSSAIRTAYRKLVLKCHPDKVQDPALKAAKQDEFQRVQQAYEILSDEKKRSEYDEDASLRKLRDELSRGMGRTAPGPRPTSNSYREPHIHTAEPRPSFKPGPPPTSPFMSYGNGGAQFGYTAEFAFRTKAYPEPPHRSERHAPSAEKAREDAKDTRRRRKDEEEYYELPRERERERERDREREREREREKERRTRVEREKDDKKERARRDAEKREKDRDRARRQDQQEKLRSKKPAYMEEYNDLDGGSHLPKKKTSGGMGPAPGISANSSSSSKRQTDSPRRAKSMPREPSPEPGFQDKYMSASEYIKSKRGAPLASTMPESASFAHGYTQPDYWNPGGDSPRARRSSQDDKKMRGRADIGDLPGDFKPPRLSKSKTSPAGALHMSSAAPRAPGLTRATTGMDYHKATLPEEVVLPPAPPVPHADPSRHSRRSGQRRQEYYGVYDDEISPVGHSPSQPRAYDATSPLSRGSKATHYRSEYYPAVSGSGRPFFEKVKESPVISRDQVYERKVFSDEDVNYSDVRHAYVPA